MESINLKGDLTLHIEDSELEAKLLYSPNPEGEEWNPDKVLALLSENGITEGIDRASINKLLQELSQSSDIRAKEKPVSVTVARGEPPEPGKREEYMWVENPIPHSLSEEAERVFNLHPIPDITVIKTEKVKKEKKVIKKPRLPFLAPREEKIIVFEKQKMPEKVHVNPEALQTGYVTKDAKIATILPATVGKPGKSVRGTPLLPEISSEPPLYTGRGVERKGDKLIATETGFLRKGKNWVEVIPFRTHQWEVKLSRDNATCYLDFIPGDPGARTPTAKEIIEKALEMGYPKEMILSEAEIELIIEDAVKKGKSLENIPLSEDGDALVKVTVSPDHLKATLTVIKGRGNGRPLDLKEVAATIRESGVRGINREQLKLDIVHFYSSKDLELKDHPLAEGKPPEKGKNGEIEITVKYLSEKESEEIKSRMGWDNPENLKEVPSFKEFPVSMVEKMAPVIRHQPVALISPPEKGKPGMDVYGKVIEGISGDEPNLKLYENLTIDKNGIIAEIQGILDQGSRNDTILLRVRPHQDSRTEITMTEDRMEGRITLIPAKGTGKPLDAEEVKNFIKQKGIIYGVDEELLNDAINRAREGEVIENMVFARGKQPVNETERQIKLLVELATGEKVSIKKDGRADFKTQSRITQVRSGQTIAELLPPKESKEDGRDITGKIVKAESRGGIPVEIGKNIREEKEENGIVKLVAEKSGELYYDRRLIEVNEVYYVAGNVNYQTGNIKFPGSVHIKGSVESGFSIFSEDSIVIGEGVEASLLSADDNIIISQGIKGAGKAVIRARRNLEVSFVEQATLLCVGDIKIKNFCLRSKVKCNGKMILESDKGVLIGGQTQVRKGLEAMNLGSQSGVKTLISFGQDYLIADQIEMHEKTIEKTKSLIMELETAIKRYEKINDRVKLEAARNEKLRALKLMEKRSLHLFTLREKFEEHFPSEIKVRGTLFPGVIIESHGRHYEIKSPKKAIRISFDLQSGHIKEAPFQKREMG